MLQAAKRFIIDRLGINRVAGHADQLQAEVDDLRHVQAQLLAEATRLRAELADRSVRLAAAEDRIDLAGGWTRLQTATAWSESIPLRHQPTISIVLPTRNRASLLGEAIESVRSQTYPHWQLVVIDDGSTDDTARLLDDHSDARVTTQRTEGLGAAAARNRGLALATGDYVAFLDDDNVMAPGWLRAVVDYTGRHPECDVLYGAQVREIEPGETELHGDRAVAGLHLLFVDPFDQHRMLEHNFIDLGSLAVRRSHPELHFDERLDVFIDWELIVRLTLTTAPHPVPVIASLYRAGASGRISATPLKSQRLAELQQRFAQLAADTAR